MDNNEIKIIEASAEEQTEAQTATKKVAFKNIFKTIGAFFKKIFSFFKSDKIKNEALFKRGGYSVVITALVLAGLILFNWLVSSLADRFNLEFDMTSDKKNSISEENKEYIENLDADVEITICGTEEEYADRMAYDAQRYYSVIISSNSELEYFVQTPNLIAKYNDYNDKITVKYVDMQSTEFAAITASYPSYSLAYGDILVTSSASGNKRVKLLTFDDIYVTSEDSSYASYGYISYTLSANRIETALTSAINYVTSADTKNVAILSGHSDKNYASAYSELLATNNYKITEISDKLITTISNEYDSIIICAPTIDFIGSELDVISEFLDNDGKMGKGLIFFADATCPSLPNLYGFLKQWGIEVGEGIVFETDDNRHLENAPSTIAVLGVELEDDDITSDITMAITDYNVPMKTCDSSTYERKATALMQTSNTAVVAPVGASTDWADYTDDDKKQFDCVIQSVESDYDSDNNIITSYVMAFSSVEFVQSTWASYSNLSNQDIVMLCTDRAAHVGDTSMIFTSKVIQEQSFAADVTEGSAKTVSTIFMFIIPIAVIAFGIVVFVRRRNAR